MKAELSAVVTDSSEICSALQIFKLLLSYSFLEKFIVFLRSFNVEVFA